MKKAFLSLLLFLLLPSLCSAAYIIHLKNGSKFETTSYWKEGRTVKFIYRGGELGLDKSLISSIEHTEGIIAADKPDPATVLPEKQKDLSDKKAGKDPQKKEGNEKKSNKERRKIKSLQRRFSYLEDQFKKVKSMSTRKAISLTRKLINFRDVALKERLAGDFEKEILQVYSMIDAIEEELNSRN